MDGDNQKASAFVSRLLANPALEGLTPLQKEEQILQFLQINASQLYPTLSSANFFSGRNWEEIFSILNDALVEITNNSLIPMLKENIQESIDYNFIYHLRQQNASPEDIKKQVIQYILPLINIPAVRRAFTGPLACIYGKLCNRYITEIFLERSYIHFELTKVQRLKFDDDAVANMVRFSIILRPILYSLAAREIQPGQVQHVVQKHFADKAFQQIKPQLNLIPDPVLKGAMNSHLSFQENRYLAATARLTAIFAFRGQSYRPEQKVDRGADTPDKSWFNIARRNFRYYGLDIKMLDELYKIAAENGW